VRRRRRGTLSICSGRRRGGTRQGMNEVTSHKDQKTTTTRTLSAGYLARSDALLLVCSALPSGGLDG